MKYRLFLLLTFCHLSFVAMAASGFDRPWKNGRLKVSDNGRYLQHANGTPFFWLGETAWLLPERLDRDEAAFYLQQVATNGYNMVQIQVMNSTPSFNVYGEKSLVDGFNFEPFRNMKDRYTYWDHLDYIVSTAERFGIYVGMVCIWGGNVKAGNMNEEQAKAYGSFLAERYKNCPNIIWIMGGDIQGDIHPEVWDALARSIKAVDHNHLMSYHPRGRCTSARWFNNREWLDFNMFQSGHRRYGQRMGNKDYPIPDNTEEDNWMYVDSCFKYTPVKPTLDDEPSYEDIPQGLHEPNGTYWRAKDVRRYAYWSVFAGSCGHTYGHCALMQFYNPGFSPAYSAPDSIKPWYEALKSPGFLQMKHLKSLMLAFPYFERVGDQSVLVENGVKYDRVCATRGKDYMLLYNYTGRKMLIDLTKISGKRKRLMVYDPIDGKVLPLQGMDCVDGKQKRFEVPARLLAHDYVVIVEDAAKGYEHLLGFKQTAEERNLEE